jgi:tetratricopeptide (TPR) repeat protein
MLSRRSRLSDLVLLFACSAGQASARQQATDGSPLQRDPDRGLEAALRDKLALVDPARDEWAVEKWAVLVEARLGTIAKLWGENRLEPGLAAESWIAADLRVAPLFAAHDAATQAGDPWSFARKTSAPGEGARAQHLVQALAAWRAVFPGPARLDFEVFEIAGDERALEAKVRLTASGARDTARLQHNTVWTSTWRAGPSGLELIALAAETCEAVALARHPQGLFADVTESVFGEALFRAEIAPGLDHWRQIVPAALEPGSLGHHGLALGDVNDDGLEDVFWCRPGGLPNKLFVHAADDGVVDASAAAGVDLLDYSSSALLADFDGDVDADLVVATGSGLVFFANDGEGRFEQKLHVERSLATSLAAADFDRDGDLDLYACSYVSPFEKSGLPVPYHDANNGEANVLSRNDGEWQFVDATAAAGLDANNDRFSLAAAWEDYDNDGDPDLYVANDFGRNNLYRNDGGRFADVAAELGVLDLAAGMGVTWGDVDDDGWMDLYVTDMYSRAGSRLTAQPGFRPNSDTVAAYRHHSQGNALFLGGGGGKGGAFRDVSEESGAHLGRWGWGSVFVDFDNDGALDLFAPNGFVSGERREDLDSFFWRQVVLQSPDGPGDPGESYLQGWRAVRRLVRQGYSWNGNERNVAFLDLGAAHFADVSSAAGLDFADDARAAARVDWDGDGDEDLLVTSRTAPMLRVLLDQQDAGRHWIAFTLQAGKRTAVGARVELATTTGRRLIRSLRCGEGYLAQSTARVHFGLGTGGVERVTVRWPDGGAEDFGSPASDALHVLERGTGHALALPAREASAHLRPSPPYVSPANDSVRIVLPTPLPLPRLALETADGKPASLLGITMQGPRGTGQPLLLVLWSLCAPSCGPELERLVAAAESGFGTGLQVLALSVDPGAERERALARLTEIAWPFARGFASEEALQILELVQATLRDDAHALALPAAFLVDPAGRLNATYQGRLDAQRLRQDLALCDLPPEKKLSPESRRDACVPFAGRWIAAPPGPVKEDVAQRLAAHGLERPAAEYRLAQIETRELSAARLEYEKAVASHRQGRLAEAVAGYRQALAKDPGYSLAAQDLAVALHQQGDRSAALAAYKQALELEPGHALTRCNLGYLYLDLGDVARAKNELEALRTLNSELATTLEERIREFEQEQR